MLRSSAAKTAAFCVLVCAVGSASEVKDLTSPLQKVIELINVLSKQLEKDGKEDEKTYTKYQAFYHKTKSQSNKIIQEATDNIAQLKSDLKENDAFRAGATKQMIDLANKIAKNSGELSASQAGRKKERALFEKNEATFLTSLDQLERSMAVMKKKAPTKTPDGSSSSASLLTVAEKLKKTLTKSSDFTLSASQQTLLDGFVRAAQEKASVAEEAQSTQSAPSFLQRGARSLGPFGESESGGGGLMGTLMDLQAKVKKERDDALAAETAAKAVYKEFESGLTTSIANSKKSKSDIKNSIAMSQEQSSEKQAQLLESQEILKTEVAHMESVETEYRLKTQNYKIRLGERADEAIAVHEAQRILSSEVAKSYVKIQNGVAGVPSSSAPALLQLSQRRSQSRRQASLQSWVTFLTLRSKSRVMHRSRTDPFAKVQRMLKGMLEKLKSQQAQDAKHQEWCDLEMNKTKTDQTRRNKDVQKMKDRLSALAAELDKTKTEIETTTFELKELTESMDEAAIIREMEHEKAVKALKEYKGAAKLVRKACKVLKAYYGKKGEEKEEDKDAPQAKRKESEQRDGLANGVIGILEISIDDFEKLYKETKEAEDTAVADFEKQQEEGGVRTAVFQKNVEWKGRMKVKMEFDQSTMNNDLKSIEKELDALNTYMDKLKASCIAKPETYAQRKAKQEEELKSLREALDFLKEG